jgi:hypothetical protein
VIVIKSNPLLIKVRGSMNLCSLMASTEYETIVKKKRKNRNFVDYFWKVF